MLYINRYKDTALEIRRLQLGSDDNHPTSDALSHSRLTLRQTWYIQQAAPVTHSDAIFEGMLDDGAVRLVGH